MVQRGVAVGIGGTRIGAVGQQGHHRLGAAMPAVAGGGQQRGYAAVGQVHVHAAADHHGHGQTHASCRLPRGRHKREGPPIGGLFELIGRVLSTELQNIVIRPNRATQASTLQSSKGFQERPRQPRPSKSILEWKNPLIREELGSPFQ